MMEKVTFTERLMEFGLTRQEATIYQCLLGEGKMTGYEVAKQTGISRSNAYNSLASMTEKGAAYLVEEGNTRKYVPVPVEEFCKNRIRRMEEARQWLKIHVPSEKTHVEGYITIEGAGISWIKCAICWIKWNRGYISAVPEIICCCWSGSWRN